MLVTSITVTPAEFTIIFDIQLSSLCFYIFSFSLSEPTISRDIDYIRQQSKQKIRKYIDETLPNEYEKCLEGITSIVREAWTTSQNTEDKKEKVYALSLTKECYSMKLDLLTNATVVNDAVRGLWYSSILAD